MQFNKALQHTITWKALNALLIFLINLLLVRLLGAGASGDFFYALTVLSLLILMASAGLESGITYYASSDTRSVFSISMAVLPILALQGVVSWIVLGFIDISTNRLLGTIFVYSNLAVIYFSAVLYAKKWFVSINVVLCAVNFFLLLYLSYRWFTGSKVDADTIIRSYIFSFLFQAIFLFLVVFIGIKKEATAFAWTGSLLRAVFTYSLVVYISNLLFFLVSRIDYYFVQKYCDAVALGNYVQVSKFGQLLVMIPSMMATVVFPYSVGADKEVLIKKVQSLCSILALLFIPVAIIIVTTGNWVFPWLLGEEFTAVYPALLFYLPGFFALNIIAVLAAHLSGRSMPGANMIGSLLALILLIAGDLLLIPRLGINAAAAVSSVAYSCCMVYLLLVYRNKLGCKLIDFFRISKAFGEIRGKIFSY